MNMYIKLHQTALAVLIDNENYMIIPVHTDLLKTMSEIRIYFNTLSDLEIENVYFEKPFLRMFGTDRRQLAGAVIHIQRHFGALVVMVNELFPFAHVDQVSGRTAKEGVYQDEILTKDVQLTEASALLKGIRNRDYSALQILSLHDCLVLRTYFNNKSN